MKNLMVIVPNGSKPLGHSSIKVTERDYAPRVTVGRNSSRAKSDEPGAEL